MANSLYPPTSPYYNTNTVNGKFLDIMVNRQIPTLASDVYWEITPGIIFVLTCWRLTYMATQNYGGSSPVEIRTD